MDDTDPATRELHRRLLMEKSGVERLKMGCDMFDSAVAIARASLKGCDEAEIREKLLERLYGEYPLRRRSNPVRTADPTG